MDTKKKREKERERIMGTIGKRWKAAKLRKAANKVNKSREKGRS